MKDKPLRGGLDVRPGDDLCSIDELYRHMTRQEQMEPPVVTLADLEPLDLSGGEGKKFNTGRKLPRFGKDE